MNERCAPLYGVQWWLAWRQPFALTELDGWTRCRFHPCTKPYRGQCRGVAPRSGFHKVGLYWQKVCLTPLR